MTGVLHLLYRYVASRLSVIEIIFFFCLHPLLAALRHCHDTAETRVVLKNDATRSLLSYVLGESQAFALLNPLYIRIRIFVLILSSVFNLE
jgi:hypothetical protein